MNQETFDIYDALNFSDGRLWTSWDRVMLLCEKYSKSSNITTYGCASVAFKIAADRPKWFIDSYLILQELIKNHGNDFEVLKKELKKYSSWRFTV